MGKVSHKRAKRSGRQAGRDNIRSGSKFHFHAQSKPNRAFKLNVFGFEKMQNPDYSLLKRAVWLLATCLCFIICFWQLYDRLSYYVSHPTAVHVTLNRTCKMEFPAFTLCPAKSPFDVNATVKLHEVSNTSEFCAKDPKACSDVANVSFDELGLTLDELWEEFSITENDVVVWTVCSSVEVKSNKCRRPPNSTMSFVQKRPIDTVLGRCLTVSMDSGSKHQGASTFLEIQMMHGEYHDLIYQQRIAAQFYFQSQGIVNKACGFNLREVLPMAELHTVRLQRKQFQNLNLPRNPCVDSSTLKSCLESCADFAIADHLLCRLPFVNDSALKPCQTFLQAASAYEQAVAFYRTFNPYECLCAPPCTETVYSAHITKAINASDANHTALWIQFSDDLIEVATEVETYKGGDLLSDIGGSLGFFLGICILHILEFFDELFQKGMDIVGAYLFKRRNKRQPVVFTNLILSTSSYHKPSLSLESSNQAEICTVAQARLIKIQRKLSPIV